MFVLIALAVLAALVVSVMTILSIQHAIVIIVALRDRKGETTMG